MQPDYPGLSDQPGDVLAGHEPFRYPARLLSGDRPMPLPVEHLPDRLPRADGVLAADHAGGNPTDGVENEIMVLAGSGTALWAEKIGVCPIAPADCIVL